MRIGEFARRAGVTPRTVRHYESIGLLAPAAIDERTGYRDYTHLELVRAVHIEQLKRAGFSLRDAAVVLGDGSLRSARVSAHRDRLRGELAAIRRRLDVLDALCDAGVALSTP